MSSSSPLPSPVPRPSDKDKIATLLSASLTAANIAYQTQEELFKGGAPELLAMGRLATVGLPSDTTIAANVIKAIELVENERLKPLLREIIKDKVPMAVLVDESTAKTDGRHSWVQVHLFAATLEEPVAFDVFIMHKSASGVNLAKAVKASLTRPGFLTEQEVTDFVKVMSTDHASAVLKACKELGTTATGDAPHAVELIVKKILRALGLRSLLMMLRKVFTRKNSTAHSRLLEAFSIPVNLFSMCVACGGGV